MSALEVTVIPSVEPTLPQLHLVHDGEVSAQARRRQRTHAVARARSRAEARLVAGLGSVVAVFTAAIATMAWAFISIPNTPLP